MTQDISKLVKLTLKTIIYFFIVFIIVFIIFCGYFFLKWWWINKAWAIIFKAKYFTWKEECSDLTLEDTKILNESFKNIGYSWWIDFWCNLKELNFFQDKDEKINELNWKKTVLGSIKIPSQIWKLKNLYEINLVDIKIYGKLPEEIWNLKNLVSLEINWTWIEALPENIKNLKKLWILYIDKYLYKKLPKEIKEKIKNHDIIDYSYYIKDYYEN